MSLTIDTMPEPDSVFNTNGLNFEDTSVERQLYQELLSEMVEDISEGDPEIKREMYHEVDKVNQDILSDNRALHRIMADVIHHFMYVSHFDKQQKKESQKDTEKNITIGTKEQCAAQQEKGEISKWQLYRSAASIVAIGLYGMVNPKGVTEILPILQQANNTYTEMQQSRQDSKFSWHSNMVQKYQAKFSNTGQQMTSASSSQQEVIRILQTILDSLASAARAQ